MTEVTILLPANPAQPGAVWCEYRCQVTDDGRVLVWHPDERRFTEHHPLTAAECAKVREQAATQGN